MTRYLTWEVARPPRKVPIIPAYYRESRRAPCYLTLTYFITCSNISGQTGANLYAIEVRQNLQGLETLSFASSFQLNHLQAFCQWFKNKASQILTRKTYYICKRNLGKGIQHLTTHLHRLWKRTNQDIGKRARSSILL